MPDISRATTGHKQVAYKFALKRHIYPVLDEVSPWFRTMMMGFDVDREQIVSLITYLNRQWVTGQTISFYYLERHALYYTSRGKLSRPDLIYACRYLFLHRLYDEKFWWSLCERGESPMEADLIAIPHNGT